MKKAVKIRVFTENFVVFIRYRKVNDRLVFDKSITKPLYVVERLIEDPDPDRFSDDGFPIPLLWDWGVNSLVKHLYSVSPNVTFVDTNISLITVRI